MSRKTLTKAELVDRFADSPKSVERYVAEGMPCTGTGRERRFPWPEVQRWRDDRIRRLEREKLQRDAPTDREVWKGRREEAEAKLAELDLAEREERLIPIEQLEELVGDLADRLRAVCLNMPGTYGLRLEAHGMSGPDAERLLEEIADEMILAFRRVADEIEADEG